MHSSHFLAFLVLASSAAVHARFGQEQKAQLAAKLNTAGCVGADGSRLVDKFSGQEISKLLAAAGACDKITLADQVVAAGRDLCGSNADQFNGVIDAAIDLVQAEHNFNPFVTLQDIVCTDASLPSESVLRGIVQIVDPFDAAPNDNDAARKERAAKVNAASASVVAAAKAAHSGPGFTGSMADLVVQNGLLAADIKGGAAGGGDNGGGAAATTTTVTVTVTTDAGAAPTGGAVVSGCNAKQMQYIVQGNEHRFALDGAQCVSFVLSFFDLTLPNPHS
ncbi:hypothetical protein BJ742DRAFT_683307 [Cladochytrium replicatum]|nr:hypothetical protein BJ742DRAFT_683307 [Cladochytrium replicatum]